ncbi:uncharacterized protein LOC123199769 [Mangifera indica]|uniref:uncharacterized protein LOC123199769 n=1 Tax=Mangifera indica TaxID=29780 RepID=UPI001CFA8482|nr:uncharacterized protein LOC123199769 [Mangifera indica]
MSINKKIRGFFQDSLSIVLLIQVLWLLEHWMVKLLLPTMEWGIFLIISHTEWHILFSASVGLRIDPPSGSCDEHVVHICCAQTGRRLRDIYLEDSESAKFLSVQSLKGDPFRVSSCLTQFQSYQAREGREYKNLLLLNKSNKIILILVNPKPNASSA